MKILPLVQGSKEWIEHRKKFFNASDAPAMLGLSKYKSRTQLMHEIYTGITPEVDNATQKLFDDGHRFEALARPLAEEIARKELYPVVGVSGKYSASFDGITMDETIIFEHKSLNNDLREVTDQYSLPEMYRVQIEQQFMVSAAETCIFLATSWDKNDQLIDKLYLFIYPDLELRKRIVDGWSQLEKDLANYVPHETVELPKPASIMALPALAIAIKGEVTLSNLPEFKAAATAYIATISTTFLTDEDFSNGEAAAKFCKEAEESIEQAKKSAIAQAASIDELMRTLDFIKGQLRDKRLIIEKLVSSEKDKRKLIIINDAMSKFAQHMAELSAEIIPVKITGSTVDFAGAIKGKKTLSSMQSAVSDELARAKIEADVTARDIRTKLVWYNETAADYKTLFADLQTIINKPMDDLKILVKSRIAEHKEAEAAREAKIIADANAAALEKVRLADLAKEQSSQPVDEVKGSEFETFKKEAEELSKPLSTVMHFQGVEPSINDLVNAVAKAFGADAMMAHKWLLEADFTKYKQAA